MWETPNEEGEGTSRESTQNRATGGGAQSVVIIMPLSLFEGIRYVYRHLRQVQA